MGVSEFCEKEFELVGRLVGRSARCVSARKNRVVISTRFLLIPKAHPAGFEPATLGSEDRYSIQLNYGCP